jgi:hypothetical protein
MRLSKSLRVIAVAFLFFLQISCKVESFAEKQAKEDHAQEAVLAKEMEEPNGTIEEFSRKYGADSDPLKELYGRRFSTVTLQNALIRPYGQPVVAAVSVVDVEKRDNEYTLYLYLPESSRSLELKQHLMFQLKCNLPTVEVKLIPNPFPLDWAEYLVAARIREVKQSFR